MVGSRRVANVQAALERMDGLVSEVEGYASEEAAFVEESAQKEAELRLGQLQSSYDRRLMRMGEWVADATREAEEIELASEEAAAQKRALLAKVNGELRSVEVMSRETFELARAEHVVRVQAMHQEFSPAFSDVAKSHDEMLAELRAEGDALSVAVISEHIAVTRMSAEDALEQTATLRREARDKLAVVGTELVVLHVERMGQLAEANEQRLQQAFSGAMVGVQAQNYRVALKLLIDLQRERLDQQLLHAHAASDGMQSSWGLEKAHHGEQTARTSRVRKVAWAAFSERATQQVQEHYALLSRQRMAWTEQEEAATIATMDAARAAAVTRAEEPATTRMRQRESRGLLEAEARLTLDKDAHWFASQLAHYSEQNSAHMQAELRQAEAVTAEAMTEWNAHVERGVQGDAALVNELLVSSERSLHTDMLERLEARSATIAALNERTAVMFDGHVFYDSLEERQAEKAEVSRALSNSRTSEAVRAAAEAAAEARNRTGDKLVRLALYCTEQLDSLQAKVDDLMSTAATEHTAALERAAQRRHAQLTNFFDAEAEVVAGQLAAMRSEALALISGEQRSQRESEEALCEQVDLRIAGAKEASARALAGERATMDVIRRRLLANDESMHTEEETTALGWQERAQERFRSQLLTLWHRQLSGQARVARDTQASRRSGLLQRRSERRMEDNDGSRRRVTQLVEALLPLRKAIASVRKEAAGHSAHLDAAAQFTLDALAKERLDEVEEVLRSRTGTAWAAERESGAQVGSLLKENGEETERLLLAVSRDGATQIAPPGGPFVREALVHALGGSAAKEAAAEAERILLAEEEEQHADAGRAAAELAAQRRRQKREAERAAEARQRSLESEERARGEERAEAAEMVRIEEEERRLAAEGADIYERIRKERAAQLELEWDAREHGHAAAAEGRLRSAAHAHERSLEQEDAALELLLAEEAALRAARWAGAAGEEEAGVRGSAPPLMPVALLSEWAARRGVQEEKSAVTLQAQRAFDAEVAAIEARYEREVHEVTVGAAERTSADLAAEASEAEETLRLQLSSSGMDALAALVKALAVRGSPRVLEEGELPTALEDMRAARAQLDLLASFSEEATGWASLAGRKALSDATTLVLLKDARLRVATSIADTEARVAQSEQSGREVELEAAPAATGSAPGKKKVEKRTMSVPKSRPEKGGAPSPKSGATAQKTRGRGSAPARERPAAVPARTRGGR